MGVEDISLHDDVRQPHGPAAACSGGVGMLAAAVSPVSSMPGLTRIAAAIERQTWPCNTVGDTTTRRISCAGQKPTAQRDFIGAGCSQRRVIFS